MVSRGKLAPRTPRTKYSLRFSLFSCLVWARPISMDSVTQLPPRYVLMPCALASGAPLSYTSSLLHFKLNFSFLKIHTYMILLTIDKFELKNYIKLKIKKSCTCDEARK